MFRVLLMLQGVVVGIFEMPTREAALERAAYASGVLRGGLTVVVAQ